MTKSSMQEVVTMIEFVLELVWNLLVSGVVIVLWTCFLVIFFAAATFALAYVRILFKMEKKEGLLSDIGP